MSVAYGEAEPDMTRDPDCPVDALRQKSAELERLDAQGPSRFSEAEARHREGYARLPVQPGEFDVWEAEQSWGDE